MMKVAFEINDVVQGDNEDVSNDQPSRVELDLHGSWVQMTYASLVSAPNGEHVADFHDGWWHYKGMKFSDVIVWSD